MLDKLSEALNNKSPEELVELSEAAVAIVALRKQSGAVPKAKISAIKDTIWRVANYRRQGIVSELVHTIFVKRMQLIGNAGTVSELKEIQAEPKPHYNGNGFSTGTFCIPEEELILWSQTSLRAPLNEAGMKRYLDVFHQVYGFHPWELKTNQEVIAKVDPNRCDRKKAVKERGDSEKSEWGSRPHGKRREGGISE